jgi:hypothetical protein
MGDVQDLHDWGMLRKSTKASSQDCQVSCLGGTEENMKNRVSSILAICLGMFALALLAPLAANAQVTVFHVKVLVDSVSYCDTDTVGNPGPCDVRPWNLGSGAVLPAAGNTLVLTQTGLLAGVGGNFDTSDRAKSTVSTTNPCNTPDACRIQIFIDTTGSSLALVYDNGATGNASALNGFNVDVETFNHAEGVAYTDVTGSLIGNPPFMLGLGYADSEHSPGSGDGNALPKCTSATYDAAHNGSLCVPTPWDKTKFTGADAATIFIGGYLKDSDVEAIDTVHTYSCNTTKPPYNAGNPEVGQCVDGGAIIITAALTAGTQFCSPGFWKTHQSLPPWPISPNTTLGSVFNTSGRLVGHPDGHQGQTIASQTMGYALAFKGGGYNALTRSVINAYLGSLAFPHPAFTTSQVITLANAAYAGDGTDPFTAPENCPF